MRVFYCNTAHSPLYFLLQFLLQGSDQNVSADPVPCSPRINTAGTWMEMQENMEMQHPQFPVMFLVPASPCISRKADWAFSLVLSTNPALLILLVPRRILRENLQDSRVAVEVKALLTLKGTLSGRALLCTAGIDLFPSACTFTDHFLITFPLPSFSVFPPFPAIPSTSPATCSPLMDWLLQVLILTWHGPFPRK